MSERTLTEFRGQRAFVDVSFSVEARVHQGYADLIVGREAREMV